MPLTCGPLFLRSTWRGQQTREGNKARGVSCQAREWRENRSGMTDTASGLAGPLRPDSRRAEGSGVPWATLTVNRSSLRCSHYTTVHGATATAAPPECQNLLRAPSQEWGLLCGLEMAVSTAVQGLWTLAYQAS